MTTREILLYYSLKYSGDWDSIYAAIERHEELDEKECKSLIKTCKSNYIAFNDDEYPESLKEMYKPPFVLYYHGDISLISDNHNKIAVVGSRNASLYGLSMTSKLVSEIANDFVIVSGMAIGVDAMAQRQAIESKGKTVAVLGCGINVCYLPDNQDLYDECKKSQLILSEYPNDVPPCPSKFPVRNRIIAGLCNTLLIMEGKIRSGTQITAMLMIQKDGNVCCVPTRAGEDSLCNALIAEGAFLIETAQDIYDATKVVAKRPIFEN